MLKKYVKIFKNKYATMAPKIIEKTMQHRSRKKDVKMTQKCSKMGAQSAPKFCKRLQKRRCRKLLKKHTKNRKCGGGTAATNPEKQIVLSQRSFFTAQPARALL